MCAIISSAAGNASAHFLATRPVVVPVLSAFAQSPFLAFLVGLFMIGAAFALWLELLDARGGRLRDRADAAARVRRDGVAGAADLGGPRGRAAGGADPVEVRDRRGAVARRRRARASAGHASIAGIMAGAALVMLAAFSPWALLRLLPLAELASGAAGALRAELSRPRARRLDAAGVPRRGLERDRHRPAMRRAAEDRAPDPAPGPTRTAVWRDGRHGAARRWSWRRIRRRPRRWRSGRRIRQRLGRQIRQRLGRGAGGDSDGDAAGARDRPRLGSDARARARSGRRWLDAGMAAPRTPRDR